MALASRIKKLLNLVHGLAFVLAIALPLIWFHQNVSRTISALAIAIAVGLLIRNLLGVPTLCREGISFSVKKILRLAIILLGVRLSFMDVIRIGGSALVIIIACITVAVLLIRYISLKMGLPEKLGTLIGVGTAICGNSAIVATAPVIEAEDEEIAFAVATITLFGVAAVFIYPLVGHLLHLSEVAFGTWAGTAINDTSQVVTAGFIYGNEAGEVATVVKLTRNLFMAPVILVMGYLYAAGRLKMKKSGVKEISYRRIFPWFVLGFLGMAVLRTLGVFSEQIINFLKVTSNCLIVVAIAGVGLGTSFGSMKKVGLRPFYAGLAASIIIATISLMFINLMGIR